MRQTPEERDALIQEREAYLAKLKEVEEKLEPKYLDIATYLPNGDLQLSATIIGRDSVPEVLAWLSENYIAPPAPPAPPPPSGPPVETPDPITGGVAAENLERRP